MEDKHICYICSKRMDFWKNPVAENVPIYVELEFPAYCFNNMKKKQFDFGLKIRVARRTIWLYPNINIYTILNILIILSI